MDILLTDAEKIAIERYVKDIIETNEKRRDQRITRFAVIAGLFSGAIFAMIAWAFTSVVSGVHDTANEAVKEIRDTADVTVKAARDAAMNAAKDEADKQIHSTTAVDIIKSTVKHAYDLAVQAAESASLAEDNLKTLRANIEGISDLITAIKGTNSLADNIARTNVFQEKILTDFQNRLAATSAALENNLQNLKRMLHTYRTPGTDAYYYGTVDVGNTGNAVPGTAPTSLVEPQRKPVIFYCKTGYYMIGVNFQSGPTGPTAAQIMCSELGSGSSS